MGLYDQYAGRRHEVLVQWRGAVGWRRHDDEAFAATRRRCSECCGLKQKQRRQTQENKEA